MRIHPAAGLLLALAFLAPGASAVERPLVQVGFSIVEPLYLERLGTQSSVVESQILALLLRRFHEEVGFLRFGSEPSALKLKVVLGTPNASKERPHEVHFRFALSGAEGAQSAFWLFRDRGTWADALGGPGAFGREIEASLAFRPFAGLVPNLFERIPVVEEGESIQLLPDYEIAWIIPYRQTDLCLGLDSRLKLATEIETVYSPADPRDFRVEVRVYDPPGPPLREELRYRILCLPELNQDLTPVRNRPPEKVKVRKVFVTTYSRMSAGCQAPASPEAVAGTLGGGR